MNNEEAIKRLNNSSCSDYMREAINIAIKALDMVEQLKNMRDNALRLYRVEDGNSDYSYGRKQVLSTVYSDLEELLEVFDEGERQ